MIIYKICPDFDGYDTCRINYEACKNICDVPDWDMMLPFDGTRQADSWWPRIIERYNDNPLGDFIHLSSNAILLRQSSLEVLLPILGDVEILPIICDFGEYKAVNILTLLDCIDYGNSIFHRFPQMHATDTPRIMCFEAFSFKQKQLEGHHVFKIPDLPKSVIFVDEIFVSEVQRHNFTGLKFSEVWNSDAK